MKQLLSFLVFAIFCFALRTLLLFPLYVFACLLTQFRVTDTVAIFVNAAFRLGALGVNPIGVPSLHQDKKKNSQADGGDHHRLLRQLLQHLQVGAEKKVGRSLLNLWLLV